MHLDGPRICGKLETRDIFAVARSCSLWVMFILVAGCGRTGGPGGSAVVEGRVTLNGVPLKNGQIQFIPVAGTRDAPVKAAIVEGRYRAEGLSRGSYSITFNATRPTGKMRTEHGMQIPETENLIPKKYAAGMQMSISNNKETKDFNL